MAKDCWKITMSCWKHMETSATHNFKSWILMDTIAPWAVKRAFGWPGESSEAVEGHMPCGALGAAVGKPCGEWRDGPLNNLP